MRAVGLLIGGRNLFMTQVIHEYLNIPRQSKYGFDSLTRDLCTTHAPTLHNQMPTIESLYIHNGSRESLANEKNLILHLHGSGFCVTKPILHSIWLDTWAKELNVPFLVPNYSKAPEFPFPHALQDVLDTYLYLRDEANAQSIRQTLGYVPENVIITGDSAGGNLTLTLLVALNEINRYRASNGEKLIPMPKAFALQYAGNSAVIRLSCSRILTIFDGLISPGILFSFVTAYLLPQYFRNQSTSWFLRPLEEVKQIYKQFLLLAKNPYISPMIYERLHHFKDVPCYIQAAEYDPLLDDSIEIAKNWKAPVILDVVPDTNHGFMAAPLPAKVKQHVDEFINFIRGNLIGK